MSGDTTKDLKIIKELSGSKLLIKALVLQNLTHTISFFDKIKDVNDDYNKVINTYLQPIEATDYINKINAFDRTKKHYEIFKKFVPLLNELQYKLFINFKEKYNNKDLEENVLFDKKYTTDLNKTPLGEDNPIMRLEDIEQSYKNFLDEINNTNTENNNNIHKGLYINNLKYTHNIVTSNGYKTDISDIKKHLTNTFNYYDKPI